jgi:hypothetical protein
VAATLLSTFDETTLAIRDIMFSNLLWRFSAHQEPIWR